MRIIKAFKPIILNIAVVLIRLKCLILLILLHLVVVFHQIEVEVVVIVLEEDVVKVITLFNVNFSLSKGMLFLFVTLSRVYFMITMREVVHLTIEKDIQLL